MGQPTPYEREFNFSEFSASHPLNQQPGVHIDAEFNGVKLTLDDILNNLVLIQRDDGRLANQSVGTNQIDATIYDLMKIAKWRIRGPWATATIYAQGDLFTSAGIMYVAMVQHVSAGALSVDINAGRVIALASGGGGTDDVLRSQLASDIGATLVGTSTGDTVEERLADTATTLTAYGLVDANLDSRITATQATVDSNYTVLATAIDAEATQRLALSAQVTTNTSGISSLGGRMSTAEADISSEAIARASADTANATNITTTTARVTTAEGNINSLGTRMTTAEANISTITSAYSAADAALASSIATVSAAVGAKTTTYKQTSAPGGSLVIGDHWYDSDDGNKLYIWSGTSWIDSSDSRFSSLASDITATNASVSSEASARASADAALSSSIGTVSSTVSGHTATLTSYGTSINGLSLTWGATFDIGGRQTGYQQYGTGSTTTAKFNVDYFSIESPSGGARTEFSSGNWRVYDGSGTLRVRMGVW